MTVAMFDGIQRWMLNFDLDSIAARVVPEEFNPSPKPIDQERSENFANRYL